MILAKIFKVNLIVSLQEPQECLYFEFLLDFMLPFILCAFETVMWTFSNDGKKLQ